MDDRKRYWIEPGNRDCQVAGPGSAARWIGVARDFALAVGPRAAGVEAEPDGIMRGAGEASGVSVAAMMSGLDMPALGASRCCNEGKRGAPLSAASNGRFGP